MFRRAPDTNLQLTGASVGNTKTPYRPGVRPIEGVRLSGYRAAPNPGANRTNANARVGSVYPTSLRLCSVFVLIGTILSMVLGYLRPEPLFGILLPIFLTMWWILYRMIRRYDAPTST